MDRLPVLMAVALLTSSFHSISFAQVSQCNDPARHCSKVLDQQCLARTGAGSLSIDKPSGSVDCPAQLDAYRDCLAEIVANCGQVGSPVQTPQPTVPAPRPPARMQQAPFLKEVAVLRGHFDEIRGAQFSNDNKIILSGSNDGYVIKWDAVTGEKISSVHAQPERGKAGAKQLSIFEVSPKGDFFITAGGSKNEISVWSVETLEKITNLERPGKSAQFNGIATTAAISANGRFIIAGYRFLDENLAFWDLDKRKFTTFSLNGLNDRAGVNVVSLAPNGKWLAVSGGSSSLVVVNSEDFSDISELRQMSGSEFLEFSLDSGRLLVGGHGFQFNLWDVENRYELGVPINMSSEKPPPLGMHQMTVLF